MDNVQESDYQELAGDPDHLQTMANHYLSIADKIRASVPVLHTLSEGDEQKSKATDALKHSAKKVADDIDKAESRYRVTAEALLEYVPYLRSAQSDAHTAVVNIQSAQGDVETTGKALTKANTAVTDSATDTSTTPDAAKTAKSDQTTAQTNAANAQHDLDHWKSKWREARDSRDTHAHAARNKIYDLIEHHNNGLKNPETHWYSGITNFVSSAWHFVKEHAGEALDILKTICKIAGFLSIFLGWVPILGEVLIGLSILGAAITLIQDIASGKGWKTILGDSIGLVLSVAGGGVGKFLGKLAQFKRVEAMEEFVASGSKDGNLFRQTFGVGRRLFIRASARGKLEEYGMTKLSSADLAAMRSSKLKVFLNDVKNPFADYDRGAGLAGNWATRGEKWADFKSNPLGLISKDVGFRTSGLSIPARIGFGAWDARGVIQTTTGAVNDVNDLVHGDWTLSGTRSHQVGDYSPDGYLLGKLSG